MQNLGEEAKSGVVFSSHAGDAVVESMGYTLISLLLKRST